MLGEDHPAHGAVRDRARKVVAVPSQRETNSSVQLDVRRGVGEGGVVAGGPDHGRLEAGGGEGGRGEDRSRNPSLRVELDFDMQLVEIEERRGLGNIAQRCSVAR